MTAMKGKIEVELRHQTVEFKFSKNRAVDGCSFPRKFRTATWPKCNKI